MTRFVWVRHGPTHAKAFTGWRDIQADLSDADALGRLSAALPDDAVVVSSDLKRASQTAARIQAQRRRLPDRKALREFDFGAWDGLGFHEVSRRWPELSRAFWEQPGDIAPPGGESWTMLSERIEKDIHDLMSKTPADTYIIVAHFGVILTQIARARAIEPRAVLAQDIAPLSQTIIDIHDNTRHCLVANELA